MFAKVPWRGLRWKISAWSFAPAAVFLSLVAIVSYISLQTVTEELALERDKARVYVAADQIRHQLSTYADFLNILARTPDFYSGDVETQRAALQSSNRLAVFDAGVVLLDTTGFVVASQPLRPEIMGLDWSDRVYYRTYALSHMESIAFKPVFSDVLLDGPGGKPVIAVATPVVGGRGEFRGVLAGMFSVSPDALNAFYGDLLKLDIDRGGVAYLVDGAGKVVFHTEMMNIGQDFSRFPIVQEVIGNRGEARAYRTQDLAGQQIIAGRAPIQSLSWGLVTEETWASVTQRGRRFQKYLLLLLILGLVAPALVVGIGAKRISQPLVDLTDAAREVAQGNFERTIAIDTNDEVEDLAIQFNAMSAQLQESYSNLESRVAARTRELLTLNAITQVANQALDLNAVLKNSLEQTSALLGLDMGMIFLGAGGAEITGLALAAQYGISAETIQEMQFMTCCGWFLEPVLQHRLPTALQVNEYPAGDLSPWVRREKLQTLVSTPLLSGGNVLGVFTMGVRQQREFSDQELDLLGTVGRQIGAAAERARLYDQAQQEILERKRVEEEVHQVSSHLARRNRELTLLNRVIAATASNPQREVILETLCHELALAFNAPRTGIALLDENKRNLQVVAEYTIHSDLSAMGEIIALEDNAASLYVLMSKRSLAISDAQHDPRMHDAHFMMCKLGIVSILLVPFIVGDEVIGTVGVDSSVKHDFSEAEIQLAERAVSAAAQALELAQTERDLLQSKEAAEAANRSKSVFLANMSHELRTPLNAIMGFAQLMGRDPNLSSNQRQNLNTIERSGEHLLSLINDVLEMSKIEAGRTVLNLAPFDLYRLLGVLESMFRLRASNKGLQLSVQHASDAPQYICSDESKLRQVLINLVSNAVKFTQSGGISLRVYSSFLSPLEAASLALEAKAGAVYLEFEVEDTGPGIPPEEMGTLFEPFVQSSTGRKSQEGTGLGLAISQQFVQLMGGTIQVESQVGKGSTFRFGIRVALADNKEILDLALEEKPRRVVGLQPGQGPYRILVVEDSEVNRQLLVKLLSSMGFEIQEASNGQEAVEIWRRWSPHLIWMDMRMPVMDGHEATRQIKSTTKGQATVIVALTASAFEEDRKVIFDDGCDDFVRKPFREQEIFERLGKHLGVRFIYEDQKPAATASQQSNGKTKPLSMNGSLKPDLVAALKQCDPAWVQQLRQAAMQADAEIISNLLSAVRADKGWLAEALENLVQDFRFDTIMEVTGTPT